VTLALVPIPPDHLEGSRPLWFPYLASIAERSGNDIAEMVRMLSAGEAQAFLVWDGEGKRAHAFLGVRYAARGHDRIGELIWLTGENRAAWVHLFGELETYLREHQGCVAIKAIARPGWSKHLKSSGYRLTHCVMEREFTS
jgi:hypothetical protein